MNGHPTKVGTPNVLSKHALKNTFPPLLFLIAFSATTLPAAEAPKAPAQPKGVREFLNVPTWYLNYKVSLKVDGAGEGSGEFSQSSWKTSLERSTSGTVRLGIRTTGPSISTTSPSVKSAKPEEWFKIIDSFATWMGGIMPDEKKSAAEQGAELLKVMQQNTEAHVSIHFASESVLVENPRGELRGGTDTSRTLIGGSGSAMSTGTFMLEFDVANKKYKLMLTHNFISATDSKAVTGEEYYHFKDGLDGSVTEDRRPVAQGLHVTKEKIVSSEPPLSIDGTADLIEGKLPDAFGNLSGASSYNVRVNVGGNTELKGTLIIQYVLSPTPPIKPCVACGSVIGAENQSLGQDIAIAGTPFALHYRSDLLFVNDTSQGLGGWTLSAQHAYRGGRLYLGSGDQRTVEDDLGPVNPITRDIPGVATIGGYLIASRDGAEVYAFDNTGRHLRTLDALNGALIYEFRYDATKRLAAVVDTYGHATTIERHTNGVRTAIVGPYGQRTELVLDNARNLTSIITPAAETNLFTYGITGLLTNMVDPRGFPHSFEYDPMGRLLKDRDPAGGFTGAAGTATANDHTVALSTALGRTTNYRVIDQAGGVRKRVVTFPDATKNTETEWPDGRRETTFADGTVEISSERPDPRWNRQTPQPGVVSVKLPSGLISTQAVTRTVTLADPSNPLSLTGLTDTLSLNGRVSTSSYSAATRTLTQKSPLGRTLTTTYDSTGQVARLQIAGLAPLVHTYDAFGRVVVTKQDAAPDTRRYGYDYDAAGNLASIIDPLARTNSFLYDAVNRTKQLALPGGPVIGFGYDADGNVTSFTPPGRPSHAFEYNALNLMTKYIPPAVGGDSTATRYEYDADRQLRRILRPDHQTVELTYDPAGCACGKLGTLVQPRGTNSYSYHPTTGLLNNLSAPGGITLTFGYDGGYPATEAWTGPVSGIVSNAYDNNFRIVSRVVNGTAPIAYKTDADGLLVQAGNMTLTRDAQNGRITGSTLGGIAHTVAYNAFGEQTNVVVTFNGNPLYTAQYTRDKLGRIATRTETIAGTTDTYGYGYDLAGRLATVVRGGITNATYTYDNNGNRLSVTTASGTVTGTYDNQDRLTQHCTNSYTYTAAGELLTKTSGTATTTYQYDALGNLMRVAPPNSNVMDYLVDGRNRRIGRKVNGALDKGFLYQDGLRIVAELDGNNNVISRFVYGSRANTPDYLIKGGVTYRIIADHLGGPRLVVDVSTGVIAQRLDYDEFGNVLADTNPGFQPFGFAGGLYDWNTKLTRFGARDYDAATGRWTARDPKLFGGFQANLYGYVANNPVNLQDPTGLGVKVCWSGPYGFGGASPKALSHWWVETSTVKRGMGNPNGIIKVEWVDQSYKYKLYRNPGEIQCEEYPTVDEQCVNDNTVGDLGYYGINGDCQGAVERVLKKCDRSPQAPQPPEPPLHLRSARWGAW